MDFSDLKTSLSNRGFSRLGDDLLGEYVNDALSELDSYGPWPYQEASVTGTAPLAIADLAEVDTVFDTEGTDVALTKRSYAELISDYGDLSVDVGSGAPWYWYRATPDGVPTIAVYPTTTRTIGVQYWRISAVLSGDSDLPVVPARFHRVIVLIAERLAHARKGDQATAAALQVEVDRQVQLMRESTGDDAQTEQIITGASEDW